jgi:hypothetical protein
VSEQTFVEHQGAVTDEEQEAFRSSESHDGGPEQGPVSDVCGPGPHDRQGEVQGPEDPELDMKKTVPHNMKSLEDAKEYNRQLPRWPKIAKDEKPDPVRDVRKGRCADENDPDHDPRQPMVWGIERFNTIAGDGVNQVPPQKPREHKQPEAGPDPDYLSPKGYKRQAHQRPGRIVAKDLRPTNRDVD